MGNAPAGLAALPILSTASQVAQELRAARIFATRPMRQAVRDLADIVPQFPQSRLPAGALTWRKATEELAFAFVLHSLNTDPGRPQILWDQNPARRRDGVEIPGSCCKGNNPDNIYRRIPLDPAGRYVLRGRRNGPTAPDMTFSVLPDVAHQESWPQTMLALEDICDEPDGGFTITLDADDAGGRRNHIRLAPGAVRLTIRESMIDWAVETPLSLAIERTDGAPALPMLDDAAEAALLAGRVEGFVRHWLGYNDRSFYRDIPNVLPSPTMPSGGLLTQISAMGNFDLSDDEALLVRADRMGAAYFAFTAMDPWMRATDYRTRTGSLNYSQMAADGDGQFTVLLSVRDPGVHNWLDPSGLGQGALQIRWQALPPGFVLPKHGAVEVRKLRLDEVARHLPSGTRMVSPGERARQLADRRAAHDRRLAM